MHATATRTEIDRFGLQAGDGMITKDSETPDYIGIPTSVDTTAPVLCADTTLQFFLGKISI